MTEEELKEKQDRDEGIASAINEVFENLVQSHITDLVLCYRTADGQYYHYWTGEYNRCLGLSAALGHQINREAMEMENE